MSKVQIPITLDLDQEYLTYLSKNLMGKFYLRTSCGGFETDLYASSSRI
jgi:hypothetical protein